MNETIYICIHSSINDDVLKVIPRRKTRNENVEINESQGPHTFFAAAAAASTHFFFLVSE